ncbi:MAG: PIN domain-containing protein [Verrucomicrobia bacterium]|nr:PIN domain-containing protein [Verrucomicrobiota bacterium]
MSGPACVDSSIVIAHLRGNPAIRAHLEACSEVILPVFVLAELMLGVRLAARSEAEGRGLEAFEKKTRLGLPDRQTAAKYADIKQSLLQKGTPIPINDLWVAAYCLQHGLPLAARDQHFNQVDGLTVLDWFATPVT